VSCNPCSSFRYDDLKIKETSSTFRLWGVLHQQVNRFQGRDSVQVQSTPGFHMNGHHAGMLSEGILWWNVFWYGDESTRWGPSQHHHQLCPLLNHHTVGISDSVMQTRHKASGFMALMEGINRASEFFGSLHSAQFCWFFLIMDSSYLQLVDYFVPNIRAYVHIYCAYEMWSASCGCFLFPSFCPFNTYKIIEDLKSTMMATQWLDLMLAIVMSMSRTPVANSSPFSQSQV